MLESINHARVVELKYGSGIAGVFLAGFFMYFTRNPPLGVSTLLLAITLVVLAVAAAFCLFVAVAASKESARRFAAQPAVQADAAAPPRLT